ncbi:phage head-tail connector protein [Alkalibacillus salilacus]|uniref:Phage protein (Predicted DNA packaging) n=1 Tax=Alkalibacillus salilacus TaxID=284582 RepID=A0ABT9VDB9_9BACI|nr:DNA-packaging protein [Alkalibacillus salilacus]MDQ0158964.1 putative phage protein (predicted DNA packaging) [Alkalibacillus salilacus]
MLVDDVKHQIRVASSHAPITQEVQDLIDSARQDLITAGVTSDMAQADDDNIDPLIKRAIVTYCKAHFGIDNPQGERFEKAYNSLKHHLSLVGDYNG